MDNKEILKLIENISPGGRDYVEEAFKNNVVKVLFSLETEQNKGVFIMVDNDDCCIFYASFLNENNIDEILEIIKDKTNGYTSKANSKEICFNVYGNNPKIIDLIRELGFKTDMEGYWLEYASEELLELKQCNLSDRGFEELRIDDFVDLFDSAYYQLRIDNGWSVNGYASNTEHFCNRLIDLDKCNQVRSFWQNDQLVGAYILKQNYIYDIVVRPIFQNRGYGSYILAHAIRNLRKNKSINKIILGVVKSNINAKRFYARNGFVQISSYAEHTYR